MKIQRKDRTKLIVIISTLVALVIGTGAVFAYVNNTSDQANNDTSSDKEKLPISTPQEETKSDSSQIDTTEETSTPDTSGKPAQSVPVPSEDINDAAVNITTLSQDKDHINIDASIKSVPSGGQCIVYFISHNGDSVSAYLDTKEGNNSINCTGRLPSLNFSYIGLWTARVVYISDNKKVENTSTIEVK